VVSDIPVEILPYPLIEKNILLMEQSSLNNVLSLLTLDEKLL